MGALVGVLLHRRVARRHQARQREALTGDGLAGGTEVQQHRCAVAADQNVRGLDVPVDEAFVMKAREGSQQGQQHVEDVGFRQAAPFADDGFQRLAALVLHHHVAGVVQLEEIEHGDDERVAEAREDLTLFQEPFAAPYESLGLLFRGGLNVAIVIPVRELLREVLFDGNRAIQIRVGRKIGYAETASAENALYFV